MRSRHGGETLAAAALVVAVIGMLGCAGGTGSRDAGRDGTVDSSDVVAPMPEMLADTVVEATGANGGKFGDPRMAVNGVRGGGDSTGGTDVFSLGFEAGKDDSLVLRWSGRRVVDGPGADVAVFENAFRIGDDGVSFMDPAVVSVSRDGTAWVDFPHAYVAADPGAYTAKAADWVGFAGITPVRWNQDTNDVDPFDAGAAGGDEFDLADLPADGGEGDAIRKEGFRFVRIRSAATQADPATGAPYPHDPASNGPDIDGVAARYLVADVVP